MIILFGVGYFMRLDLAELAMASAVCIGGPSSAPALASAKGWRDLLIPGILCGSLGYGIGSFIGGACRHVAHLKRLYADQATWRSRQTKV